MNTPPYFVIRALPGLAPLVFETSEDRRGDVNVINEVVRDDAYEFRQLATSGLDVRVALDVGAHVGSATCAILRVWPRASVAAVEPEGSNAIQWGKNVRRNELQDRASLFEGALSYSKDRSHLWRPIVEDVGSVTGGACLGSENGPAPDVLTYPVMKVIGAVDSITVEELAPTGPIDLLKLDCEGGEIDFLTNAAPEVFERIRVVVGEYHVKAGEHVFRDMLAARFPRALINVWPMASEQGRLGKFRVFNDR